MILGDVFERFTPQSPIMVMARAVLENALAPQAVDRLFETVAERHYTRTLLFASIVDLMGLPVVTGQNRSLRAEGSEIPRENSPVCPCDGDSGKGHRSDPA